MSLGIVLLYGPTGWQFLISEVTLYPSASLPPFTWTNLTLALAGYDYDSASPPLSASTGPLEVYRLTSLIRHTRPSRITVGL